jgi:hypothetical protein
MAHLVGATVVSLHFRFAFLYATPVQMYMLIKCTCTGMVTVEEKENDKNNVAAQVDDSPWPI